MKLFVDCTPLHSGGGVQVAIAFLDTLNRNDDIDWSAIVPDAIRALLPDSLQHNERITIVTKTSSRDVFAIGRCLKRAEREFTPDVVFTVFGPAYFHARAPHLVGFAIPHLIYEPFAKMPLKKRLRHALLDRLRCRSLRRADHLVVETDTVRQRLSRRLEIKPGRIAVIGNSLNPVLARHTPVARPTPGKYGLLIPSTYYPHKNLEIVPQVAQQLAKLDPALDFEFRFTLEPDSAPWKNLLHAARQLGVTHHIKTLGPLPLDDLADAYQAASAIFLPTLREASTAVYPESFYFQRPLITSDVDFARELCDEAALYVPPSAPNEIAAQIHKLANSPELADRLTTTGTQQLTTSYPTPPRKFEMQIALLKSLLPTHSPHAAPICTANQNAGEPS